MLLNWGRLGLVHYFRLAFLAGFELFYHLLLFFLGLLELLSLLFFLALLLLLLLLLARLLLLLFLLFSLLDLALHLLQLFLLALGFLFLFMNTWFLTCLFCLFVLFLPLSKLLHFGFKLPIPPLFSFFLFSKPSCFILFFLFLLLFLCLSLWCKFVHRCPYLSVEIGSLSLLNLSKPSLLFLLLSFSFKDWIFMFHIDLLMIKLNCLNDVSQSTGCLFGCGSIFDRELCNFLLQWNGNMS